MSGFGTDLIRNAWDLFNLLQLHLIRLDPTLLHPEKSESLHVNNVRIAKWEVMGSVTWAQVDTFWYYFILIKRNHLPGFTIIATFIHCIQFFLRWSGSPTFRRRYWRLPSCSHSHPSKVMEPLPSWLTAACQNTTKKPPYITYQLINYLSILSNLI